MNEQNSNRTYVQTMLAAGKTSQRQPTRKLWGISMDTLLPFMVATNARGDSAIPHDALGAPLRLVTNEDGTAKFSKANSEGVSKPIIRVAKPIADHVKLMREGYIASIVRYTADTQTEAADAFNAELKAAEKAGAPILANDAKLLKKAIDAQMEAAADEAEANHANNPAPVSDRTPELVTAQ